MDVQSILVYSLILIFFIALPVLSSLVLVEGASPERQTKVEEGAAFKTSKLAYGLVVALFALFIVLTFLSHEESRHVTSK